MISTGTSCVWTLCRGLQLLSPGHFLGLCHPQSSSFLVPSPSLVFLGGRTAFTLRSILLRLGLSCSCALGPPPGTTQLSSSSSVWSPEGVVAPVKPVPPYLLPTTPMLLPAHGTVRAQLPRSACFILADVSMLHPAWDI